MEHDPLESFSESACPRFRT